MPFILPNMGGNYDALWYQPYKFVDVNMTSLFDVDRSPKFVISGKKRRRQRERERERESSDTHVHNHHTYIHTYNNEAMLPPFVQEKARLRRQVEREGDRKR